MTLVRVAVMAAAILGTASVAWAQRPDFSGTWGAPAGCCGAELVLAPMTVKQTADALTIERTMGDASATLIYKLDGSPSRNVLTGPSGQEVDIMSTAAWDGGRLTILGKREMGGQIIEMKQVWSVEGDTLTVESTGTRGSRKLIYKK